MALVIIHHEDGGIFLVHPIYFIKCVIASMNNSEFIQPEIVANQSVTDGVSFVMWGLKLTLGKINTGGIDCPIPFTQQHIVIKVPLSAEKILPTCLDPFLAIIFPCF